MIEIRGESGTVQVSGRVEAMIRLLLENGRHITRRQYGSLELHYTGQRVELYERNKLDMKTCVNGDRDAIP